MILALVVPVVVWDSSMLVTCFALRCVFVGRCQREQNDNKTITKTDNKINPKAIFKHHGPLITLP